MTEELNEVRASWDRHADEWQQQVGEHGDSNRLLNSDPVLWKFAGDVAGRDVLDAGCGTGYLSRQLHRRGARVVGVDISPRMCEIARSLAPEIPVHVDSCCRLASIEDASQDLVIANYVLMDTPELEGTVRAFCRTLRDGGIAVLIFSHPCFPQGDAERDPRGPKVTYHWSFEYFQREKRVDPPWSHFSSQFIWYHRPLSDYWKAFRAAGFFVEELEEPRLTPERYHLAADYRQLDAHRSRPYSIAFKLRKWSAGEVGEHPEGHRL